MVSDCCRHGLACVRGIPGLNDRFQAAGGDLGLAAGRLQHPPRRSTSHDDPGEQLRDGVIPQFDPAAALPGTARKRPNSRLQTRLSRCGESAPSPVRQLPEPSGVGGRRPIVMTGTRGACSKVDREGDSRPPTRDLSSRPRARSRTDFVPRVHTVEGCDAGRRRER